MAEYHIVMNRKNESGSYDRMYPHTEAEYVDYTPQPTETTAQGGVVSSGNTKVSQTITDLTKFAKTTKTYIKDSELKVGTFTTKNINDFSWEGIQKITYNNHFVNVVVLLKTKNRIFQNSHYSVATVKLNESTRTINWTAQINSFLSGCTALIEFKPNESLITLTPSKLIEAGDVIVVNLMIPLNE